jgi:hypothetical protein
MTESSEEEIILPDPAAVLEAAKKAFEEGKSMTETTATSNQGSPM